MFKLSITGKANSGKNTLSKLLINEIFQQKFLAKSKGDLYKGSELIAFADPIKEMAQLMFPNLNKEYLYGPSHLRNGIVPQAFKDGSPLTIRNLLQDIGTGLGRSYKDDIWLDVFNHRFSQVENLKSVVIIPDVRFRNEFDHLKQKGFYQIKLIRDSIVKSTHISETNQDGIKFSEFHYVVHNNGTIEDLESEVVKIVQNL
jgi:hypothetical protein